MRSIDRNFASHAQSAYNLMHHIGCRQGLLYAIAKYITVVQTNFFDSGNKLCIRPLKQVECAAEFAQNSTEDINSLESRISRILNDNTIAEIDCKNFNGSIKLKEFFSRTGLDEAIKEIIDSENKAHPLSDEKISTILKEQYDIDFNRLAVLRKRVELGFGNKTERKVK